MNAILWLCPSLLTMAPAPGSSILYGIWGDLLPVADLVCTSRLWTGVGYYETLGPHGPARSSGKEREEQAGV